MTWQITCIFGFVAFLFGFSALRCVLIWFLSDMLRLIFHSLHCLLFFTSLRSVLFQSILFQILSGFLSFCICSVPFALSFIHVALRCTALTLYRKGNLYLLQNSKLINPSKDIICYKGYSPDVGKQINNKDYNKAFKCGNFM